MENAVYILLGVTSIVCVAVIGWRAWVLRWNLVVPPKIAEALTECRSREDAQAVRSLCEEHPSPLGRLRRLPSDRLDWPKDDNMDSLEIAARHEIVHLERLPFRLDDVAGLLVRAAEQDVVAADRERGVE